VSDTSTRRAYPGWWDKEAFEFYDKLLTVKQEAGDFVGQ
jgi:hypothetical protein